MPGNAPSGTVFGHDWFDRLGGVTPIHENLHRSAIPAQEHHFDALEQAGIRVVFSFEEDVPGDRLRERGFDWRPHFWVDDEPPSQDHLARFIDDYRTVPRHVPALVHCRAGWGRAGTAATCVLIAEHGMTASDALRHFWARVPGSEGVMRKNGQAECVHGYAASLAGRGLG